MLRVASILFVLVVGTVAAAATVLHFLQPGVTVTEAVEGPVVQAFYSTGTIQPEREYPIKSNIAGTIDEVRVDKGARVKKGEVLATVKEPNLEFAAREARAMLDEKLQRANPKSSPILQEIDAKLAGDADQLDIARREQKRVTDLMEHNAGSQTDLDRAMDRVRQLVSDSESLKAQRIAKQLEMAREVEVAQAAFSVANWNLQQQTLTAPLDGVILDRPLALRTRVAINDPIMRMADVSPENLIMRAAVDEEDVAKVNVGQTVRMTLYAFPGQGFRGSVLKIYDQADSERRTFEIDVKIVDHIQRLQPGMTGELAFVMDEKPSAVVIPAQAIQADGSVFVVRDRRMARTSPKLGLKSVERVEVLSGIAVGETVVISALKADETDHTVRTTRVDPRVAAGLNKATLLDQPAKTFEK